jgi:hypothetical protein
LETTGAVYTTAAGDRAVFLTGTDLASLQAMLDVLEARPTVAGPPLDVESLRRLARAVDLDDGDEPSSAIVLSEGEQRCLELLRDQALIRDKLPMRVRQTCTACGDERIINPARQAQAAEAERSKVSGRTFLASAQLLSEGHPVLATLSLLGGLGTGGGQVEKPPVCPRCEGDEYEHTPITFCPGCRAVRDESVLLRCPECDFEFIARRGGEPLWISTPEAMDQYNRVRNQAALRRRAKDFENGLWPNQLQALVESVDAEDRPLVMCRCGRPGETGRYLALLLTSEHLVWAWESPLSGAKSGRVHWRDVRTVHELGTPTNPQYRGFRVECDNGESVAVVNFRGTGVSFADAPAGSTVEDLLTLVSSLHRRHGGSGDVVPTAVPLAPSAPPPALSAAPASPSAPPALSAAPAFPSAPPPALAAPPPAPAEASAPMPNPPAGPARGVASVPIPQPAPQSPPPAQPTPVEPGWYADPWRAARLRWWNGTQWTGHTSP